MPAFMYGCNMLRWNNYCPLSHAYVDQKPSDLDVSNSCIKIADFDLTWCMCWMFPI